MAEQGQRFATVEEAIEDARKVLENVHGWAPSPYARSPKGTFAVIWRDQEGHFGHTITDGIGDLHPYGTTAAATVEANDEIRHLG